MPLPILSHPIFDLTVPSSKEHLTYRPFLVKEEKILLLAQEADNLKDLTRSVKQIINNCVLEGTIDVDNDPTFDIEGIDSAHKIAILSQLAYGTPVKFDDITIQGISGVSIDDIECAREFGYRIKLLAISKFDGNSVDIRVHPAMIPQSNPMANVNGVLNAVRVCDDLMEENILIGHGAGSLPTGSAVVADIIEISIDILCGSKLRVPPSSFQSTSIKTIPILNIESIDSEYFL